MSNMDPGFIQTSGIADELPEDPENFKQLSIQETLTIPVMKPDAEQITCITAQVIIKNTKIIDTPSGTSVEGQILTGRKLTIEGLLSQKIEYVADEQTQAVHAIHYNTCFSTFIVLPRSFKAGTPININGYIEDIYIQLLDKRTIFKNVTILLDARFV